MRKVLWTTGQLAVLLLFTGMLSDQAYAWPPPPTHRSNHVPNVGQLVPGGEVGREEQPLGDMWTFFCPPGGHVVASVDTKDDTDLGTATLDPILELLDGNGVELAHGDDENTCTYAPVCGFACPALRDATGSAEIPCGDGGLSGLHSLIVRDFGTATNTGVNCNDGGGYELTVDVFDEFGNELSQEEVALGGGASRGVPDWAQTEGKAPVGPALDDENVPLRSPDANKGQTTPPPPPPTK
jgi:hypothetical protein